MFAWFKKQATLQLPFHTDIHCHLTPGVDDGSQSVEKSVDLMKHMQQWGITRIIPTPHVTEDTYENTPAIIAPAYRALVAGAADAGVDIELLPPSGEYRLDNFFIEQLGKGDVKPLRDSYLLVENSFSVEPWGIDNTLYMLTLRGFRPVLAHPERYVYYHKHLDRYRQLHDSGVLFQCNLMSLGGYYGKDVKFVANKLLEENLIDFLGTDLHGMRHVVFIEDYMKTSHFCRVSDRLKDRILNDRI